MAASLSGPDVLGQHHLVVFMAQGEVLLEPSRSRLVQVDNRGKGIDDFDVFYPLFVDRRVQELGALSLRSSIVNLTSSASNCSPSDHLTPSRRFTVIDVKSSLYSNEVACQGMTSPVFRFVYISGFEDRLRSTCALVVQPNLVDVCSCRCLESRWTGPRCDYQGPIPRDFLPPRQNRTEGLRPQWWL